MHSTLEAFLANAIAQAERAAQSSLALHRLTGSERPRLASQLSEADWHEVDSALDLWISKRHTATPSKRTHRKAA